MAVTAAVVAVMVAIVAVFVFVSGSSSEADDHVVEGRGKGRVADFRRKSPSVDKERAAGIASADKPAEEDDVEEGIDATAEAEESGPSAEDKEEALVDAFDAETDRWMSKEDGKPPTMKDVDEFVAKFKAVPAERKEECLQRALNLVSDENVMLLAGILMDKTLDKELVELVYNDILNRDESVKKPILQEIFKDKAHPCWADTAWIFDVTSETPDE